jgi:hypothetical protein
MYQISPLLNDYDIVCVQEDFNYHDVLTKDIKHKYKTRTKGPVPLGDGLNIFSNYEFNFFQRIKWVSCYGTDCLTPKGFSYCKIKIGKDDYIDLYNFHCNAGSGENDMFARRKNIEQMCDFIKVHSEGNAVILLGDSNNRYTRSGDDIRAVINLGFTDVWIEKTRNNILPDENDSSLMNCGTDERQPTCEVVDKIFYRSNDKIKLSALDFQMQEKKFTDIYGHWLSDHRPLYAKINYKIISN